MTDAGSRPGLRRRFLEFYEKNETKVDLAFFLAGFLFDVFTLADIDDPLSIAQQVAYFLLIGGILSFDFLESSGFATIPARLAKAWNYRELILHFFLGSLLSIYSLFFLKSSSFGASTLFVLLLMGVMVANEMKVVQKGRADVKVGLYFVCVFSFFAMMFPVVLGFVGAVPLTLAVVATAAVVLGAARLLERKTGDRRAVRRVLTVPATVVLTLFLLFDLAGWIPPVPLSVQNMGVYHAVERVDGNYALYHEKPWWKFWRTGDQDFRAQPGDRVYFFARVFSPGRFDDSVILHWQHKDPREGWKTTDRVSMRVVGGRRNGYRGFSVKANYAPGDWRVGVETTDGREIGRFPFEITSVETDPARTFERVIDQ